MPLVDSATVPPHSRPDTVRITDPQYKGVAVDLRYIPATDLNTHVEGSSWTVDAYFSQVLDQDSGINGQSVNKPAQLQQYRRITQMEFKVTSPLVPSQDPSTKKMSYKGGANIYAVVIPNEGDMFLVRVDDGRLGIFTITSSEKKSLYKDSIFAVEYSMVDYASPERILDLETKIVQKLTYVRDYLQAGQNPLVEEDEWAGIAKLHTRYESMLKTYTKQFMSREFKTIIAPGQPYPTYDAWLVRSLTDMFQTTDTPELLEMRQLDCDDDPSMKCVQLWNVLLQKDPEMMRFVNRRAALVWVTRFTRNPMLNGIRWSGINLVVYPVDPELTVDQGFYGLSPITDATLIPVPSRKGSLTDLISQTALDGLAYADAPLIHPVLIDDYYVLSQAFYENTEGQSKLELLVQDYLHNRAIDHRILLALTDTYHGYGGLERFYYTPIILLLIRAAIRRV